MSGLSGPKDVKGLDVYIWKESTNYRESIIIPYFKYVIDKLEYNINYQRRESINNFYINNNITMNNNKTNRLNELETIITCIDTIDCIYRQGYTHASNRLIQLDILRQTAKGKLSAIYGVNYLQSDYYYLSIDLPTIVENDYTYLSHEDRLYLEAYTNGINEFVSSYRLNLFDKLINNLPYDYTITNWDIRDSLLIYRLISLKWSHGWEEQVYELLRNNHDITIHQSTYSNTNNFIPSIGGLGILVSSNITNSKGSLLYSTIQGMEGDSIDDLWYINTLSYINDDIIIRGASVPGLPFIIVGYNNYYSWSIIKSNRINEKISLLEITDSDDCMSSYRLVNNNYKDIDIDSLIDECIILQERDILIDIYYQKNPINFTTYRSNYGPIISNILTNLTYNNISNPSSNYKLAYDSIALSNPISIYSFHLINQAKNFNDFKYATSLITTLSITLLYADIDGNIGSITTNGYVESNINSMRSRFGESDDISDSYTNSYSNDIIYNPIDNYIVLCDEIIYTYIYDIIYNINNITLSNVINRLNSIPLYHVMILSNVILSLNKFQSDLIYKQQIIEQAQQIVRENNSNKLVVIELYYDEIIRSISKLFYPMNELLYNKNTYLIKKRYNSLHSEVSEFILSHLEDRNSIKYQHFINKYNDILYNSLYNTIIYCRENLGDNVNYQWSSAHSNVITHRNQGLYFWRQVLPFTITLDNGYDNLYLTPHGIQSLHANNLQFRLVVDTAAIRQVDKQINMNITMKISH